MRRAATGLACVGLLLPLSIFGANCANASNFDVTVQDFYWGGLNNYSGVPGSAPPPNQDVIEASWDHSFDIYGINATRVGNDLTVTVYTNYANTVTGLKGADNTYVGDLFLANGPIAYNNGGTGSNYAVVPGIPSINNQSLYHDDTAAAAFGAGLARFQYAADAGGQGVYSLNQSNPGSDVQLSYWGGTPGTNFRGGQAVNVTPNTGTSVVSGDSVQVVQGAYGSSDGTNDNFGGGEIIFTMANLYQNISLGDSNGTFTLAWAMTCANDTIYATITPLNGNINPAPLPASLPLFTTGIGLLGFLRWRRRQKTNC